MLTEYNWHSLNLLTLHKIQRWPVDFSLRIFESYNYKHAALYVSIASCVKCNNLLKFVILTFILAALM